MIHLKCTIVNYANLNLGFKNKPFLNYGLFNMLFRFFRFHIYVYFNETFVKNFMTGLSLFNTNFQNSCQDVAYYRILCNEFAKSCDTEYKAKFEKKWRPLFRSKIGIFDIFFKRLCKESFADLEINSN